MRVNARFEGVAQQQVEYLVKTTGRGVSEVLRDSVAAYYQQVRAPETHALRHLGPLLGTGNSGHTDLSVRYKDYLTESWSRKYGLTPMPDTTLANATGIDPAQASTDTSAPVS